MLFLIIGLIVLVSFVVLLKVYKKSNNKNIFVLALGIIFIILGIVGVTVANELMDYEFRIMDAFGESPSYPKVIQYGGWISIGAGVLLNIRYFIKSKTEKN